MRNAFVSFFYHTNVANLVIKDYLGKRNGLKPGSYTSFLLSSNNDQLINGIGIRYDLKN